MRSDEGKERPTDEVEEEYKGCRIFGRSEGERPAYQGIGRLDIPLPFGNIIQRTKAPGQYTTQEEAIAKGLESAMLWIISNAEACKKLGAVLD